MATVRMSPEAAQQLDALPPHIRARIALDVFARLARWPQVSGAKPLRGELAGNFRIRTGDYRVVFRPSADASATAGVVRVWKIGHRQDVYSD